MDFPSAVCPILGNDDLSAFIHEDFKQVFWKTCEEQFKRQILILIPVRIVKL